MTLHRSQLITLLCTGALAIFVLAGCGVTSATTPGASGTSTPSPTATTPATPTSQVTTCAQLPAFASASPVGDFFSILFPANTMANGVIPPTAAAGQFGVVAGDFCTPNSTTQLIITGGHGPEPFLTALLFEGWVAATTFPVDGYLQQPCSAGGTCFSNPGNNNYLTVQNVTDHGNGVISYHLVVASAPTAPSCNSNFSSSPTPGFFPFLTSFTPPVPLPPLSRIAPNSAAGLTGIDICSAGTATSVATFMTTYLASAGYSKVGSDSRCFYDTECWTSASSALSWDATDPTDWHIAYHHS